MNEATQITKDELVRAAREAGYPIDEKLIDRWVSAGLLDQAEARGRGKSRGVERTWSENQRHLLLTLLGQHATARKLTTLTNVPVITWVIWGDDFVPLRQVKRALETYTSPGPRKRPFRGRAWARELVARIALPGATGHERGALTDALLDALEGDHLDEPHLARLFSSVVGPTAPSEQADGPRMLELINSQWSARTRFGELTDGHFRWARAVMLAAQADYTAARPLLAADPRFGHLHGPFDFQTVATHASHSLLTILGIGLTQPIPPSIRPELQLEPWLAGRLVLETVVTNEFKLGLKGAGFAGLHLEVRVTPADAPTRSDGLVSPRTLR